MVELGNSLNMLKNLGQTFRHRQINQKHTFSILGLCYFTDDFLVKLA